MNMTKGNKSDPYQIWHFDYYPKFNFKLTHTKQFIYKKQFPREEYIFVKDLICRMKDQLFVYGTLMKGIPSRMSDYLQQHALFVGAAYANGHLYDLGQYPGFVYDRGCDRLVKGHVFQLKSPKQVFPILDRYEGIEESNNSENEYLRTLIDVRLNKKEVQVWTYLFNRLPKNLPLIPEGDYLIFYPTNQRHLAFIQGGRSDLKMSI